MKEKKGADDMKIILKDTESEINQFSIEQAIRKK